ncbi:MAG TPA: hypothetical protein DCM71_12225 [Runella sp.]|nr:hypothetical protein [Runella sp.]
MQRRLFISVEIFGFKKKFVIYIISTIQFLMTNIYQEQTETNRLKVEESLIIFLLKQVGTPTYILLLHLPRVNSHSSKCFFI